MSSRLSNGQQVFKLSKRSTALESRSRACSMSAHLLSLECQPGTQSTCELGFLAPARHGAQAWHVVSHLPQARNSTVFA